MTITRHVAILLCLFMYLLPNIVKAEEHVVNAAAREFKPAIVYVQPGDTVKLELSPYDLGRGRLTYRYK